MREYQFGIRITGQLPGAFVDGVVVVPAEADEILNRCCSSLGGKNNVMNLVNASIAMGNPAVHIAHHDGSSQHRRHSSRTRERSDEVALAVDDEWAHHAITHQRLRLHGTDGSNRNTEALQPTCGLVAAIGQK